MAKKFKLLIFEDYGKTRVWIYFTLEMMHILFILLHICDVHRICLQQYANRRWRWWGEMTEITKQSDRTSVFMLSVDSKEILNSTYAHARKICASPNPGEQKFEQVSKRTKKGKTELKTITVLIFTDSLKCVTAKQIKTNTRAQCYGRYFM